MDLKQKGLSEVDKIRERIARRLNGRDNTSVLIEWQNKVISKVLSQWLSYGPYADSNFITEFCGTNDAVFAQRYWEMYLCNIYLQRSWKILPHVDKGPDIALEYPSDPSRKIFIEAIAPTRGEEDNTIPSFPNHVPGQPIKAFDVPLEKILLRWTNAFDVKKKKIKEYIIQGIIRECDFCIIAINGCLFGEWKFPGIHGGHPIIEALYPVGPKQVHIKTGEVNNQYRPQITKNKRVDIPTNSFLVQESDFITGVIACSIDEINEDGMLFVPNYCARNKLPPGLLPVDMEYEITFKANKLEVKPKN